MKEELPEFFFMYSGSGSSISGSGKRDGRRQYKRCSKDFQAAVDSYCKFWVTGDVKKSTALDEEMLA
jgi:hypothetical protein